MKAAIAADHGGYELKGMLKEHLTKKGIEVFDLGTDSTESVDYPIYGEACARYVASGAADFGIVCCGSGIGISIAANKVRGIRCALVYSDETARLSKEHNNANMLAFGERTMKAEDAKRYLDIWLDSEFQGGRHERRVALLDSL